MPGPPGRHRGVRDQEGPLYVMWGCRPHILVEVGQTREQRHSNSVPTTTAEEVQRAMESLEKERTAKESQTCPAEG